MRLFLPAAALAVVAGSLRAPAQAQQRAALPVNTIGSGPVTAARTSALSAWTTLAKMPVSQFAGGHAILDGKIYLTGGYASGNWSTRVQIYDIATNTWSSGAPMPKRLGAPGSVAKDGVIYSIGGVILDTVVPSSSSLTYTPTTDTWAASTLRNYPWAGSGQQSNQGLKGWVAPDGKIYIQDTQYGTDIYNPVTNSWGATIGPPSTTGQFQDRYGHALVLDANGLVHAFGGGRGSNGPTGFYQQAVAAHSVYNPATGLWTAAAPMPLPKLQASAVLGSDGNLYVIGGGITSADYAPDVQIYNPTTNTWAVGPSLPIATGNTYVLTQGNDIYVVNPNGTYRATITVSGITWTGAVSSSWTEAGNWSSGTVPTATDDVTIPAGLARYPSITSATPTAHTLTVASGAQLSVADGGTLSLTGNLVNNGSFSSTGSGTLAFTGATAQVLGGTAPTTLTTLRVGPAGATLAGPVTVQRQLTLQGNLTTTGQSLVLASSSTGTALVVNRGGVVTGPATVQRYIEATDYAGAGYRHFSPALSGARVADLTVSGSGAVPLVVNAAYNLAAEPSLVTPFPTVFAYAQSRVSTDFGTGWMSPAAASALLPPGQGLTIQQQAGTTLALTGPTLTTGTVSVQGLSRGSGAEAGWQLLGNPYPSPVDWSRVSTSNLEAAAYVYRATGPYAGGYTAYVNGIGRSVLAQGQAFFVRVNSVGAVGSATFTNAARDTSYTNPGYARPARPETRPLVQLLLQRAGSTTSAASQDEFYVYEQAGATAGFDGAFDAVKVQLNGGTQPSLYQVVGTQAVAIQGLPAGTGARSLQLGVNAPEAGSYVFSAAQLLNLPAGEPVWLEDKLSNTWHDLRQGSYAVNLSQGLSTTRFVLHLHQGAVLGSQKATSWKGELQLYPNPASNSAAVTVVASGVPGSSAELVLLNVVGQIVRQQPLAVTGKEVRGTVALSGLAPGIYSVQVRSLNGVLTHQLALQ
ncbi:T9SS type A sorting domain-containing protein [Hymenobacter cellulosivorans]|uniref:T9SS type A sorting domain-containing protein n=1 Tax=Hymenobacter cellulosivorans TaxID=2932249 RepID=A0ABY4FAC3_9BACT|nr:T9SS type A sorting domain-containing protein [Hymenobacter cellulosivorans]UOQ53619.1 T9SS type A sorting domain-containing protein [Hymenobacter cellulosivorans]